MNKNKNTTFKEAFKDHIIEYKQPYMLGAGFIAWFLLLIIFATVGQTAPYNKTAFELGGFSVAWYAIFILTGAVYAVILAIREAHFLNVNRDHFFDGGMLGIILGIIGARLYYVIFNPPAGGFSEIFNIRGGGLAIHGGVIVGVLFAFIYTKIRKMDRFLVMDLLAPGFLIGQIIGRWGNFFNQEAHGGPMSEGARNFLRHVLPSFVYQNMNIAGTFYHPTFLYESLWNLAGLILLLVIRRKKWFKVGDMIGLYLIWYGLGRGLLIEPFRTDALLFITSADPANFFLNMINRVNVVLSLTLFTTGGILYIYIKNKLKPELPYYFDVVKENEEEALFLLSKEGKKQTKENKKK